MNKHRFARINNIAILIFLILLLNYRISFSESFQRSSNNMLINPSEIKWVRIVGGLNMHSK